MKARGQQTDGPEYHNQADGPCGDQTRVVPLHREMLRSIVPAVMWCVLVCHGVRFGSL
jgi:hypothetical protein